MIKWMKEHVISFQHYAIFALTLSSQSLMEYFWPGKRFGNACKPFTLEDTNWRVEANPWAHLVHVISFEPLERNRPIKWTGSADFGRYGCEIGFSEHSSPKTKHRRHHVITTWRGREWWRPSGALFISRTGESLTFDLWHIHSSCWLVKWIWNVLLSRSSSGNLG